MPENTFEAVREFVLRAIENAGPEYHTGKLAVEIYNRMCDEEPELTDRFIAMIAVDQIKIIIARTRSMARRARSPLALRGYDITEVVDGSNTQRRTADMIRHDVEYVGRSYISRGSKLTLRGQRFLALLPRMPNDTITVRECIPETDIEAIYDD